MNSDNFGAALKEMAERWETPTFEAETLAQASKVRSARRRHRVVAAALVVLAASATTTVALVDLNDSNNGSPVISNRPAMPPPVRVRAIDSTDSRIDGDVVMARVSTGISVTVHARLMFLGNRPAAVKDAALVVAKPGTGGGVGGGPQVDAYFTDRHLEIVRGSFVTATSPEEKVLTVTTPGGLRPGQYPVFYVYRSVLLPGQERGIEGPFTVSGEVGIIVIDPHE